MFDYLDRPYYGPAYPFAYPQDYLGRFYSGPMYPFGYMGDWYEPYSMHQTSGLSDITIGPHLISPFGIMYAWGQGLGLWGQKEDSSSRSDKAADEHRRSGGREHGRDHGRDYGRDHGTDWSMIAWAGLGLVGVFGAIYLITRKHG